MSSRSGNPLTLTAGCLAATALLAACEHTRDFSAPTIGARVKPVVTVDGQTFKDLNGNGAVDPYEDWRLSVEQRIEDLVGKMTPEEKAGMMLIQTLNSALGGTLPENASQFVTDEHMTRFIFRNPIVASPDGGPGNGTSGPQITPQQAATFTNGVQQLAESTRLGIPALFKSNVRNHYELDAQPSNVASGSFSTWPKEPGLAATRDLGLIRELGITIRAEWTAIGVRGVYGYMADLATEPRWFRVHETFTEDADLAANIITTLVGALQGEQLGRESVTVTIKHFPGGGPQEGGGDPHYWFGRNQAYPSTNFDYHVRPFKAAIDAGAAAIMPYYGIPVGQRYAPNDVGMAFSKGIVTDLLRGELGFDGYVNSDTGVIGPPGAARSWGLGAASIDDQLIAAIEAGTDVLSGFNDHSRILGLVTQGRLSQTRVDESVKRLLEEQLRLGLFENPYVDANVAAATVGKADFRAKAELAQRKSIVLLQNQDRTLPLATPTATTPIRVYTMGMNADAVRAAGYAVTTGDHAAADPRPTAPPDTRYALLRVAVTNPVLSLGEFPNEPDQLGGPPATIFGGALPNELDFLAFSDMVSTRSWVITPSLADIQAVMNEVGAANTVLSIYFRQPWVIDEASGMRDAGALVALFGVDDFALVDVLTGKFTPQGKLPFALASNAAAIVAQAPDTPGYPVADTLFPFGFGLTY